PYGVVGGNNCPVSSVVPSSSSSSVVIAPSSSSRSSAVVTVPSSSSASSTGNNDPLQPVGVENSGAGCFIPALASYANLTANAALPDPFRSINGNRITSKYDWTCRRAEVSKQAQFYELGEKPEPSTATVSASASGNNITVNVQANGQSISFNATVQYPSTGSAPFPAVIGVGGSSLNNSGLLSRGIAVINFPNNDIAEQTNGSSRGKGKFYTLYGSNHGAGAMTAWAWGVSRLIDALEKTPGARIDVKHLGVTGCSRNGKGALIVGALDERIALTIPQESGSGGSAAWRVSDAQKSAGQNVQTLSQIVTENVWFRSNFSQFGSTATRLPFDHHQVLGMVAPRALLVLENTDQEWLGNVSTYTSAVAGREIWSALGVADRMSVSQLGGYSHCVFPSSQQAVLDAFVDKFLKGSGSGNTSIVRTSGSFSVDRARWINWTTPNLQ
ncbi:MAG: dockerin-like protein, partial [Cellvibrio sp.]|uniref:glucuronyl esterase domain-containing protein n=1 Tax=Cellvibrio sp. TaxID=1965322 RepID=UPI0031A9BF31